MANVTSPLLLATLAQAMIFEMASGSIEPIGLLTLRPRDPIILTVRRQL